MELFLVRGRKMPWHRLQEPLRQVQGGTAVFLATNARRQSLFQERAVSPHELFYLNCWNGDRICDTDSWAATVDTSSVSRRACRTTSRRPLGEAPTVGGSGRRAAVCTTGRRHGAMWIYPG
jgi:hypothetical protein